MSTASTTRSTKVLWALVLSSLSYNVYDLVSSNEAMSQQLNLNRSQASDRSQLRTNMNDLDARLYDLESALDRTDRKTNNLEWDLTDLRSELENHQWYDH